MTDEFELEFSSSSRAELKILQLELARLGLITRPSSLVFTMNFVPVPIAKLEFSFRFENGCNRTTAIVNSKRHGSINHLKNKVVPSTLDCQ